MKYIMLLSSIGLLLIISARADTQCFLAQEGNIIIAQEGDSTSRHAPCSTFKIAISLMGYNERLLIDATHPEFPFKRGYADAIDRWRQSHNPTTWMQSSCVWYSQIITQHLGIEKFGTYVTLFNYGNQDISGDEGHNNGLTHSWLSSSLQISPKEQLAFLRKLLNNELPVSLEAQEMTKKILFMEDLPGGWKLYGKTGSGNLLNPDGTRNKDHQIGWFIGWIEKGTQTIIFVYYIEDERSQGISAGQQAKEIAKRKLMALIEAQQS